MFILFEFQQIEDADNKQGLLSKDLGWELPYKDPRWVRGWVTRILDEYETMIEEAQLRILNIIDPRMIKEVLPIFPKLGTQSNPLTQRP